MLGWEFPPHVTGGLGVACEGLVRGLLQTGTPVSLVLPGQARRPLPAGLTVFEAASGTPGALPEKPPRGRTRAGRGRLALLATARPASGYSSPPAWRRRATRTRSRRTQPAQEPAPRPVYGSDLVTDVLRYAEFSGRIAGRQRFDVIHAHDWLT